MRARYGVLSIDPWAKHVRVEPFYQGYCSHNPRTFFYAIERRRKWRILFSRNNSNWASQRWVVLHAWFAPLRARRRVFVAGQPRRAHEMALTQAAVTVTRSILIGRSRLHKRLLLRGLVHTVQLQSTCPSFFSIPQKWRLTFFVLREYIPSTDTCMAFFHNIFRSSASWSHC